MTSYTKPEVHNVLHCDQRRTELRTQVTCTENFDKVLDVVDFITRADRQTDRQTYRHTCTQTRWSQYFAPHQGRIVL